MCISNILGNKTTKTIKTSKQKPKARTSCLLRMKLEDVAVSLELVWDRECHGRAGSAPLAATVGSARVQEAFPPAEGSSDRRRAGLGGRAWLRSRESREQSPCSFVTAQGIAVEFCAVCGWTGNLLIFLGKFSYKLSLCTCDTDARIS